MALLGSVRFYHRRRDRKSPAHDLLFLAVVMCLLFVGKWAEGQMDAEAMASADANRKMVAITFEDGFRPLFILPEFTRRFRWAQPL